MYKRIALTGLLGFLTGTAVFAQEEAPVQVQKSANAKVTNLAPTPPMGWNSWNTFQTRIDEKLLRDMVDTYVASGMRDAGYQYFTLDDGWMSMERDKNGQLEADPKKFPSGMKAFADYVHSKGLKFGIYNCAGDRTCAGYPGTRGHEYEDARLYASWGVDFLKYDWCNTDSLNAREAYITMARALQATGRPVLFSLCEWGNHQPWLWANGVGEMYRATGDITANFDKDKHMGTWTALSVLTIVDKQPAIRQFNGPNHWNDPDMLEVGNGMSPTEDKAHFTMWCILSAPLVAGNDLRKMSEQTKSILTNKELVAIDQDKLGIAAYRSSAVNGLETWIKPLSNGKWAVCFLNRSDKPQALNHVWAQNALNDSFSKRGADFTQSTYKLHDVWAKKDVGTTKKAFRQTIPAHDVVLLTLTK
ncbi:glycoside hydrolase family 27 protein [Mucilaginibacter sp. Bleaf8]|uniref:glycoside hydrolase family 27 protein n=1 Tax=Mucilaginibacter sp. Bleaf8 TaxID=2834430 RepID=UPI001BCEB142|nr:glycoside hydrolase family 27 protein [Mucilaginibacter sp. Bleaf8]MBS7566657.1 glycoside hydrolase family 27 protein [Mucilaginibacter sp. Bleaf8]